ncbi:MAG TPA: tryptophan-rich sensory protein [Leptolyngbyaceae cyanobacterium M33_DOE_097]|uniref:TspO protein n=1 Tax=Oscillatoriales cyanobacterium SpSt-418 TaxID=2282169 RepID=A0A7C3PLV3_9CYAN|nr:tryptophan-rich sensory protein [Leptolyngbyaceae cyanobacterium M33_DOE_097]
MLNSWIIIGVVTTLVAFGSLFLRPRDIPWAVKLDRPKWLFFEPAIPLIWTVAFFCGAWSAGLIWQSEPGSLKTWLFMGLYILVEVVTVAYIPITLRTHSLAIGTFLGGLGVALGIVLALLVAQQSTQAALLLLPYLLWSPVGTYTTRRMIDLNPEAA